jgi:DNA invertase Pin-like site-specific DNA recombinase
MAENPTGYTMVGELDRCRAYAAQHGYVVVGEFNDAHDDKRGVERPGVRALLEAIASHGVKVVIVFDHDQVGTSPDEQRQIFDAITATGARVESTSDNPTERAVAEG